MKTISGHIIAHHITSKIKKQIETNPNQKPGLGVILVGNNPASHLYVGLKEKKAREIGMYFSKTLIPDYANNRTVIKAIKKYNKDDKISGIIVQLPLPSKFNTPKIIRAILPSKDADGIHPKNIRRLKKDQPLIIPATTLSIIKIIKSENINLTNKSVCIIGKSKIVGLPTYYYLRNKVKSISICDRKTRDIRNKTRLADIIIVAVGHPHLIDESYLGKPSLIIDVGITKRGRKTLGDLNPQSAITKECSFTPVPGGVGPVTVASLLKNVYNLKSL